MAKSQSSSIFNTVSYEPVSYNPTVYVILPTRPWLPSQLQSIAALLPWILMTEAHVCEQLAEGRYMAVEQPEVEPTRDIFFASP